MIRFEPSKNKAWNNQEKKGVCKTCGIIFYCSPSDKSVYCSRRCRKTAIQKICKRCGKSFMIWSSRVKRGRGIFCSKKCRDTKQVNNCFNCGKLFLRPQCLINIGWNKYCSKKCKDIKQKKENHPRWKGDEVSYGGLHDRVRAQRGRPHKYACADCGNQAEDWSNVDGKYGKDVYKDFQPRCRPCHRKYDLALRINHA